jgi:hypothetical protein
MVSRYSPPKEPDVSNPPIVIINLKGAEDALIVHNKRSVEIALETEDDEGSNSNSDASSVARVSEAVFGMDPDLLRSIEDRGLADYTRVINLHHAYPPQGFPEVMEEIANGDIKQILFDKELDDGTMMRFSLSISAVRSIRITGSVRIPMEIDSLIEVTKQFAASLLRLGAARITDPLRASAKPLATLNRTLRGNRNRSSVARTVMNNPNLARITRSFLKNTGRNYNRRTGTNGRNRNLGHLKDRFKEVQRVVDGFAGRMMYQRPSYNGAANELEF